MGLIAWLIGDVAPGRITEGDTVSHRSRGRRPDPEHKATVTHANRQWLKLRTSGGQTIHAKRTEMRRLRGE